MKISSITLENFRPYKGKQRIEFATTTDRNVTVLYGTNGGGKTTLLNAFTWGLYGYLSEDVEDKDQLINTAVWQATPTGALVEASVTIEFEHLGDHYTIKRTVIASKRGIQQPPPRPEVTLLRRHSDGRTEAVSGYSGHINKILPERLSRFFFVNGERIEALVKPEAYSDIQDAIKTLLGLESVERSVKHLPKVEQRLLKEIKADGEVQEKVDILSAEIEGIDREIEEKTEREKELKTEIAHLDSELKLLNMRLIQLAGAKELQQKRYRLEDSLNRKRQALADDEKKRAELVAKQGFLSFIPDLPAKIVAICEHLRQRGELPAPLKKTFIEDLLHEGTCICGTHLPTGSSERQRLEEWRSKAGLAEVEAAWNSLKGAIETVDDQREQFIEALRNADQRISEHEQEIKDLLAELDQVSKELKQLPTEDAAATEERREEVLKRLEECHRESGDISGRLGSLHALREEKDKLIRKLRIQDEASQRLFRRLDAVKSAKEALSQILTILSNGVRTRLDERIHRLFADVSLKNYTPELTEEFRLELWDTAGGGRSRAIKSTGENMLLSLAFVGALAREAKAAGEGGAFFKGVGGDFPVVMDAVFGNLDNAYRRAVARFLPELTPQVIVLTSEAQAGSVVERELRDRIGRQYVITTHTTKTEVADATREITLNGSPYPYQVIGSHMDGAVITEVKA